MKLPTWKLTTSSKICLFTDKLASSDGDKTKERIPNDETHNVEGNNSDVDIEVSVCVLIFKLLILQVFRMPSASNATTICRSICELSFFFFSSFFPPLRSGHTKLKNFCFATNAEIGKLEKKVSSTIWRQWRCCAIYKRVVRLELLSLSHPPSSNTFRVRR